MELCGQLFETEDNRAPPGATVSMLRAADGLALRAARWAPKAQARGTVVVFQGRAECLEKYFETIGDLLARDFAVVALDWRGQGLSDRELPNRRKGHIDDFSLYRRDIAALVAQILQPLCPQPWFALAHSMGAAILIAAARTQDAPFARIVVTAPMIEIAGVRRPRLARLLIETLDIFGLGGAFIPGGGETSSMTKPFAGNQLTADSARYARNARIVAQAPQLALGDPTIGWLNAAFRLTGAFAQPEFPRRVAIPLLAFGAGVDTVVSTQASARFFAHMKAGRMIELPGARHEILQESDAIRAQFWAAFDAFIPGMTALRAPAPPAAAQAPAPSFLSKLTRRARNLSKAVS